MRERVQLKARAVVLADRYVEPECVDSGGTLIEVCNVLGVFSFADIAVDPSRASLIPGVTYQPASFSGLILGYCGRDLRPHKISFFPRDGNNSFYGERNVEDVLVQLQDARLHLVKTLRRPESAGLLESGSYYEPLDIRNVRITNVLRIIKTNTEIATDRLTSAFAEAGIRASVTQTPKFPAPRLNLVVPGTQIVTTPIVFSNGQIVLVKAIGYQMMARQWELLSRGLESISTPCDNSRLFASNVRAADPESKYKVYLLYGY